MRRRDHLLCHRRLFREREDQAHEIRPEHHAPGGLDLRLRGHFRLPRILSIAGSRSSRALT